MLILGIETSCDETAVAVVHSDGVVLSHQILSQPDHVDFGGVVPELASRAHMSFLQPLIERAMQESNLAFAELAAVSATAGPGLIGGLIVGTMMAKGIASAAQKPFIAVNHLEAHSLVVRMVHQVDFPFLLLIISGGHCQFLIAKEVGKYVKLGATLDDSLGEAFDKVAKMIGFPYPGGPVIEKQALSGNKQRFNFPRALLRRPGCDFSFSGLKTAVRQSIVDDLNDQDKSDICASFQECIADVLLDRLKNATAMAKQHDNRIDSLVIAGGVAANIFLRHKIEMCAELPNIFFPPTALCTDNAIMVAWAGLERFACGYIDPLNFPPRPRWPLENM